MLWYLSQEKLRFNQIKKLIPEITDKTLTDQLKKLEKDKLIVRVEIKSKEPKIVEYSLTDFGESLNPLLQLMVDWSHQFFKEEGKIIFQ
ncbi:helix-turn-helix domain-containing protein [Lewinella sp. 4G2]|uniref:winged helix-turn-helix transcriptional regulator n=1 Tax=Lewinella sp. 4G2 TaxID=1803372 RepID=UPI0009EED638|nr:helix-turn-helix domain-containing protein [Lewinella sp. 4G2]